MRFINTSLIAWAALLALSNDTLYADEWAERGIFISAQNRYVGVRCVMAKRKTAAGGDEWKLMRKGESFVKEKDEQLKSDEIGLGQLSQNAQSDAVLAFFRNVRTNSIDDALSDMNKLDLIARPNPLQWTAKIVDPTSAIIVEQNFNGVCLRFKTPRQLLAVLSMNQPPILVSGNIANQAQVLDVPDPLDKTVQELRRESQQVLLVPSPLTDWPEEALILVADGKNMKILWIPLKMSDKSAVQSARLMFDAGKGVHQLDLSPEQKQEYDILRSVALFPHIRGKEILLNSSFGWGTGTTFTNGDNAGLLSWTPSNIYQTEWVDRNRSRFPIVAFNTVAPAITFGLPGFGFDKHLPHGTSVEFDNSSGYSIVDGEVCPDTAGIRFGGSLQLPIPFVLITVNGKPVYIMARELTLADLFEIVSSRDPDETKWWRTADKRKNEIDESLNNLGAASNENQGKVVRDWIRGEWSRTEAACQLGVAGPPSKLNPEAAIAAMLYKAKIALLDSLSSADDPYSQWTAKQVCREIAGLRSFFNRQALARLETSLDPTVLPNRTGVPDKERHDSFFTYCCGLLPECSGVQRRIFERYWQDRVELGIDFPSNHVNPLNQPLTNISWKSLKMPDLLNAQDTGRTDTLSLPCAIEWSEAQRVGGVGTAWNNNRRRSWPAIALDRSSSKDIHLQELMGNVAEVIDLQPDVGLAGGFYRDGAVTDSGSYIPMSENASSGIAGFRLAFRKEVSPKLALRHTAITPKVDKLYQACFGTGTRPGGTIPFWVFEKKYVINYFGESDEWLIDHLRDIVWGPDGDNSAGKELPPQAFLEDAQKVLGMNNH